jgi:hypothetical protein
MGLAVLFGRRLASNNFWCLNNEFLVALEKPMFGSRQRKVAVKKFAFSRLESPLRSKAQQEDVPSKKVLTISFSLF